MAMLWFHNYHEQNKTFCLILDFNRTFNSIQNLVKHTKYVIIQTIFQPLISIQIDRTFGISSVKKSKINSH